MTSFEDIGVQQDILKSIVKLGYEKPTPIQEQVIPKLLSGEKDLIALAQTGTGKTASFGIPIAQLTDTSTSKTQSLVLCPTRELCIQVAEDIKRFTKYIPRIKTIAVYGGTSIVDQMRTIKRGVQIIVATPGRLNDLIRRKAVNISHIRTAVLDEADEMLNMGFKEELNAILAVTPSSKRTLLFSATMPKEVAAISKNYMTAPEEITVGDKNQGTENVSHEYYLVENRNRYAALKRIADMNPDIYSIVFCRTRQETKDIAELLIKDGYNADALHGDLSQAQRDTVMTRLRTNSIQMLIATDVAARGIDVKNLTHVINYNLPDEIPSYTHRSGRTGRAGQKGISIAIISPKDKYRLRLIEKILKVKFKKQRIPSGHEICKRQLLKLIQSVKDVEVNTEQIDSFATEIFENLEELDREEIITRFISYEFNRFLQYYKRENDLNVSERQERGAKGKRKAKDFHSDKGGSGTGFTRFSINIGKQDGMNPRRLIDHINETVSGPKIRLGEIRIGSTSATVEADTKFTNKFLNAFQHQMINGKFISVKVDNRRHGKDRSRHERFDKSPWKKRKSFRPKKGKGRVAAGRS